MNSRSGLAASNPLAYGVAANNNRTNSQGAAPISPINRATITISNIIPANGDLPVPCQGNKFYVSASSAPINIRPAGGAYVQYATGTGLDIPLENTFDLLDIHNPNNFAIAFQIQVGFDNFVDNRLILAQQQQPLIAYATNPIASANALVQIRDLSGQQFSDPNGNQWYALYRSEFVVSNVDTGVTLILYKKGGNPTPPNNIGVGVIYPTTAIRFPFAGDYDLNLGGGAIPAIVTEVYAAIPKT